MSLNWKNSLRTIKLRPPEEKKSANSLENDFSNIPIYTQILNYEQSLKKLIVNVWIFYLKD